MSYSRVSFVTVIMGAHNIETSEPSQLGMLSTKIIIHEDWDTYRIKNDIALIKLPRPVIFNCKQKLTLTAVWSISFDNLNLKITCFLAKNVLIFPRIRRWLILNIYIIPLWKLFFLATFLVYNSKYRKLLILL